MDRGAAHGLGTSAAALPRQAACAARACRAMEGEARSLEDGISKGEELTSVASCTPCQGPQLPQLPPYWTETLSSHSDSTQRIMACITSTTGKQPSQDEVLPLSRLTLGLRTFSACLLVCQIFALAITSAGHQDLFDPVAVKDRGSPLFKRFSSTSSSLWLSYWNLGSWTLLVLYGLFEYLWQDDHSRMTQHSKQCLMLAWMRLVTGCLAMYATTCGRYWFPITFFCYLIQAFASVLFSYFFHGTMLSRIEITEAGFGDSLGSSTAHRFRLLAFLVGLGSLLSRLPLMYWNGAGAERSEHWIEAVYQLLRAISSCALALIVSRALNIVRAATCLPEAIPAESYLRAEARWADTVLSRVRLGMLAPCAVNSVVYCYLGLVILYLAIFPLGMKVGTFSVVMPLAYVVSGGSEAVCIFAINVILQPQQPGATIMKDKCVLQRTARLNQALQTQSDRIWERVVQSLAYRRVNVVDLLEFYQRLGPGGDAMGHFDPSRHTTNDVVRMAVVPLSLDGVGGGTSYAEVIERSRGLSVTPECMVTHCWSNLFVHLVAAVVADALGLKEYSRVASLLCTGAPGIERLERALKSRHVSTNTYWICCFCVNQHSCICGGFGAEPRMGTEAYRSWDLNRRDTVTGEVFVPCSCLQPKYFNDHTACELDKFDCMMIYLMQQRADFRQVVAVDESFNLFTRAWCVAELVEGHFSGMPQRLYIMSDEALEMDAEDQELVLYTQLATFSVAACEASRPADRAAILARIPDVAAFDAHLQALVLGHHGLLGRVFGGFGTLQAAAFAARRVSLAAQRAAERRPTASAAGISPGSSRTSI